MGDDDDRGCCPVEGCWRDAGAICDHCYDRMREWAAENARTLDQVMAEGDKARAESEAREQAAVAGWNRALEMAKRYLDKRDRAITLLRKCRGLVADRAHAERVKYGVMEIGREEMEWSAVLLEIDALSSEKDRGTA